MWFKGGSGAVLAVLAVSMVGPSRGNRFQEAWVMNCEHTFPDGTTYDLSPLTRTAGRPDYMGRDKANNNYYMNICSNVQEIPKECRALNKNVRSPVYQVRNDSFCHWLGLEGSHRWDLIEKDSPLVGVQLTYTDGEYCREGGGNRQVKLQIYCDGMSRLGSVADYYVTADSPCSYVVTFPSPHGCPKVATTSKGASFLIGLLVLAGAYFGGGVSYNVIRRHMPLDVEAVPHIEFWRALPATIVEQGYAFLDWVMVKIGKREPHLGEAEAGGAGYEWTGL
ncbi:hypothetical protein T484DRAFT_1938695 [Baffinella frigidus]|nr:hypothetical protein T484DRAFT_1938695 [Cryptophyta sp. CCMP2293]